MVQQLRADTALAEDPSSVLRTPFRQLTSDKGDLRPKGLWAPAVTCTYPQANMHTRNKTEIILRNWRDGLVVKSRYCSSRGPEFSS